LSAAILDPMDNAGVWSAHAADGSPSTLLRTATVTLRLPDAVASGSRVQLQAQAGSAGHYAERTFAAAADLSDTDELRLWTSGTRAADGTDARPFFLRLRLASAAVGFDSAANTWVRLLPCLQPNVWQLQQLTIADLPAPIRGAVTAVRLEATGAQAFACVFDSLIAVQERVLADVESSLVAELHEQVKLKGAAVPASVYLPGGALPAAPNIRVSPALIEYAPELSVPIEMRTDYTPDGFSLRPARKGYQLYYDLDADGAQPTDRALLLDFALDRLTTAPLRVNGEYLPVDVVPVPVPTSAPPVRLPVRIRVRAWKSGPGAAVPAKAVKQVTVEGAAR